MNTIPTKINKYNVYKDGTRLLGSGDEMSLPEFEASSETVSGAGILGEIDDPAVGYFGNQEMDVPFRILDHEAVDMLDMTKAIHLEIRGAQQTVNTEGTIEFRALRVVVRGRCKKFAPGKMKAGSPMETTVTLSMLYILIELEGKPILELDKINEVYKIKGNDVLEAVKEMC